MNAEKELQFLMKRYTRVVEDGFAIDISHHEYFDYVLKEMGLKKAYLRMAEIACSMYEEKYHEPYLLSEKCMAYEIEYHVDAYMVMMGYRGYIRNVTTFLLPKFLLVKACEEINISTYDLTGIQGIFFRYKQGIRPCYRGSERDPFKRLK